MLTLRMAKWPEDTGLVHKSTTWQIAEDSQFSNILDEDKEDETFLDVYYSKVVVPIGKVYYGRSKRHFDNGSATDWIGVVKLLPVEAGENVDLKPEVKIESPFVELNKDEIIDPDSTIITLKTGSFRCDTDGHTATHWVLRNATGKVLFVKMYDSVNKTKIVLSKADIDIAGSSKLILEAAHVTTNNYESAYGKTTVTLNKFKFEPTCNVHSVSPIKDFKFTFKLLTGLYEPYPLQKVIVKDTDGVVRFEKELSDGELDFTLNRTMLKESSTYYVDFYQKNIQGEAKTITVNTTGNKGTFVIDEQYEYKNEYTESGMSIGDIRQCSSEQFLDSGIPLPETNNSIPYLYNYDRRINTFSKSDLPVSFLKKSTDGHEHVNFKILDVNRVIIDRRTGEDNAPEFTIYDYEKQLLLGTAERKDEDDVTGLTNAMTVSNNGNKVYYFAKVDDSFVFRVLDTETMEISDLAMRDDVDNSKVNLTAIGDERLMSFNGGSHHLAYIYDIKSNMWTDVTLVPEDFRELVLTSFLAKNGKVLSFNTGDNTNDILSFNPLDNKFSRLVNKLDDTINLDTTIRLRNGEFLRCNSNDDVSKIYLYR